MLFLRERRYVAADAQCSDILLAQRPCAKICRHAGLLTMSRERAELRGAQSAF